MRSKRIVKRYSQMMNELSDHELMACIYMLCNELIHRDNSVTMEEVLTSILNIGKLIDHNKKESEV